MIQFFATLVGATLGTYLGLQLYDLTEYKLHCRRMQRSYTEFGWGKYRG